MLVVLIFCDFPNSLKTSVTCCASSLVGVSTTTCRPRLGCMLLSIGMQKARVFPDPVSAWPTTSF